MVIFYSHLPCLRMFLLNHINPTRYNINLLIITHWALNKMADILQWIFTIWNNHIAIHNSLNFVPKYSRVQLATDSHLKQWWPRYMAPYDVTRPQWVKHICSRAMLYGDIVLDKNGLIMTCIRRHSPKGKSTGNANESNGYKIKATSLREQCVIFKVYRKRFVYMYTFHDCHTFCPGNGMGMGKMILSVDLLLAFFGFHHSEQMPSPSHYLNQCWPCLLILMCVTTHLCEKFLQNCSLQNYCVLCEITG